LFFGLYFIAIHQATLHAFFWPLVSARSTGILALGLIALLTRQPAMPPRGLWGIVILNGILDIAGNGFYVLAARTGRLDVAAVLGALYPASTVLLAWMLLKERLSVIQIVGMLFAFTAIILFTL
jgi:drug/metabolite transporter (DMT)-like permease